MFKKVNLYSSICFPIVCLLVFGVLVFMKCNFLFTAKPVLVTFKRCILFFNLSDFSGERPLHSSSLAGRHSLALGASGSKVGSQGAGGLGA